MYSGDSWITWESWHICFSGAHLYTHYCNLEHIASLKTRDLNLKHNALTIGHLASLKWKPHASSL